LERYELEEHEMALLREVVRTVDLLDDLAAVVASDGPVLTGPSGTRVHPAVVESRQLKIALARLQAALRLPSGEEPESRRPQRRVGVRGVYNVPGVHGAVS
jgi:hypothetical protein